MAHQDDEAAVAEYLLALCAHFGNVLANASPGPNMTALDANLARAVSRIRSHANTAFVRNSREEGTTVQ